LHKIGDYVICSHNGVCQIRSIGALDISSTDPLKIYYTMDTIYSKEVIYVPIHSKVFIRPLISRIEAEELIRQIPSLEVECLTGSKVNVLASTYEAFLQEHECIDLVRLIKTISRRNEDQTSKNKKMSEMDRRYLRKAQDLLFNEFSITLGLKRSNAEEYMTHLFAG